LPDESKTFGIIMKTIDVWIVLIVSQHPEGHKETIIELVPAQGRLSNDEIL